MFINFFSVFASEISQIILFLIFNKKELKNNATLCLLRVLLSSVMSSLVEYIVDPDNLNLLLLRMVLFNLTIFIKT